MSYQFEDFDEKDFEDVPFLLEQVTDVKTTDGATHTNTNLKSKVKEQYLSGVAFTKYPIPTDCDLHRCKLPVLVSNEHKTNFWKIISQFIGKDLSKVSLPIQFNEPLSAL